MKKCSTCLNFPPPSNSLPRSEVIVPPIHPQYSREVARHPHPPGLGGVKLPLSNKKGQVAMFIIIALVIVAGVTAYFVFRDKIPGAGGISAELAPVFDFYQSCIEQETKLAIQIAGAQGGRIDAGDYVPGSEYAPFSSQLNFVGFPVSYWSYVSANGIIKEQVPSKSEMEEEIEKFVGEELRNCDFEIFYSKGFDIDVGEPNVEVNVLDNRVEVEVSADMSVSKAEDSGRKLSHNAVVDSKLGKFYDLAKEIYEKQREEAFLEDYAVDVLRLYAPVDGVEIQCGPKVWKTREVVEDIKIGLEANIGSLKFEGDYYALNDDEREYFVIDQKVDESVNLLYSRNWPTKVEIFGEGVDDEIMIVEAVGTQAGLGAMGFCYVPYHFVYDVSFPTMIQIYNTEEMFQFPVVVIIDNNVARGVDFDSSLYEYLSEEEFNLCDKLTQPIEVNIFDVNLNKVDANVSYECFSQKCRLGQSSGGRLVGVAPACVNGYLHLRAGGFADKKELLSTNSQEIVDVILEREYELEVELMIDGSATDRDSVVSFTRDDGHSTSVSLPEFSDAKLSEGSYEIRVYVYGNSSVVIPESTKTQCQEIPREGLLGFFGSTKEECFDITIPETKIDYALIGGGKSDTYLLESELRKGKLIINVQSLPKPNSIEDLANNFELFETRRVEVRFDEN